MTKTFADMKSLISFGILIILTAVWATGCTSESTSLFDPDYTPERPDPEISSISPEGGYLAGVDEVVITGENFSENADEVRVYFDGTPGIVNSASATEVRVRPARVVGENLPVKLSVLKAVNFSNVVEYDLSQAVFQAPGSIPNVNVLGIATDAEGNIYFSSQEGGIASGIKVWSTDDSIELYQESSFNFRSIKFGPDNLLYGVSNVRAVFRENPDGVMENNAIAVGNIGEIFISMDFDEDGYLWIVGDNENIIKVNTDDGSIERFPFPANLRAIRYFEGKIYFAGRIPDGTDNGSLEVWTMDINSGQASNPQQYLNISDFRDDNFIIYDITFDITGRIYIGADTGSGIYTWSEEEGFTEFYPGLIEPIGFSFAWHEEYLVASATNREEETRYALRINTLREGAPYYGID